MNCACGSKRHYETCCGAFITGQKKPQTALELMKSRYTAYAINHLAYIQNSMSGKAFDRFSSQDSTPDPLVWTQLEICETDKGGASDMEGMVRFKAYYFLYGMTHCLHEKSQFLKREGQWFYIDGDIIS